MGTTHATVCSNKSATIRPAAVAGAFYPGNANALAAEVASLLADVRHAHGVHTTHATHTYESQPCHQPAPAGRDSTQTSAPRSPKAIIAPHAGYIYSGPIAASIYSQLEPLRGQIRRVVLIGPAHRVWVRGIALPGATVFASPLGDIEIDTEAVKTISTLPQVSVRADAHAHEHCLEVQLPFLQSVLGRFKLVPLVVGEATPDEVAEVLDALWGNDETLVVVSSDLSHYLDYRSARAIDGETAREILSLSPGIEHEQACGATAINGLLTTARRRGMEVEQVDLRNSGDTAGDKNRVVGYGAFAFREQCRLGTGYETRDA